jgi:hypothetical protein
VTARVADAHFAGHTQEMYTGDGGTMPAPLVTVGSYSTKYEADLVRLKLEDLEFHPTLADAETVSVNWLWSNALGGVKVQVPASESEEARGVLTSEPGDDEDRQDAGEAPVAACPRCGSPDSRYFLDKRGSFLTWLMLGIPILPATSKRVCSVCGRKWKA